MDIKKLTKPNILSLQAYHAEEIPCRVKLDANESPYGLSPKLSVLKRQKVFEGLNRYPDPEAKSLKKFIAREFKVKPENILLGNGSDELIFYLITTFGGPVLYPVPTFSMYSIISQALGEENVEILLDKEFDIDSERFLKTIKKKKPKLIFLSSPNNPTGNSFSSQKILKIIKAAPSLVVVDEAYQAFSSKKSFVPLLKKYKNLVILKTLSKIGLAGLRIGFMIARPDIIKEVNKVRLPFNLNALSQKIAVEALKQKKLTQSYINSIISERERLFKEMGKMKNIKPYLSDANFILFKVKHADKIYKNLLKKGILVKNMKGIINGCLRVTVGTPAENATFLKILKQLL
jgi:histidinol-phosphate aminotransferase